MLGILCFGELRSVQASFAKVSSAVFRSVELGSVERFEFSRDKACYA